MISESFAIFDGVKTLFVYGRNVSKEVCENMLKVNQTVLTAGLDVFKSLAKVEII